MYFVTKYFFGHLKKTFYLSIFLIAVMMLSLPLSVQSQQTYGDGVYGNCKYSEGCEPKPEPPVLPTVITVPPGPSNPQPGRVFSVNISDGQVFTGDSYTVITTPNFPTDQIERVVFLVDGVVIQEVSGENDGKYYIDWKLPKEGTYVVSIIVYLIDGETVRQDFTITVRGGEGATEGEVSDTTEAKEGNVVLSWFERAIISPIGTILNKLAQSTPVLLAYTLPYGFLALLGLIAGLLVLQTRNQLSHILILIGLLEKDKQLADEKTTFIMLVSHYLRTPLTILASSLEMVQPSERERAVLTSALAGVESLRKKSEAILSSVENNKFLQDIKDPDISATRQKLYRSWKVVAPALLSIAVIIALNILYITAGRTRLLIPNIALQAVLCIALGVSIFILLQHRRQRHEEESRIAHQRAYEEELDKARNNFIKRVAKEISPILAQVKQDCSQLTSGDSSAGIQEALSRLTTMINRFVMASELEKGKIAASMSSFDLDVALNNSFKNYEQIIRDKKLRVTKPTEKVTVTQNDFLVRYVINSLLDNAVRYSKENGTLVGATKNTSRSKTSLLIKNQGEGISPEKLEGLFKPFTRVEGVETFNQQGIGLNLYLSRLITRYLGGDIELQSRVKKDTTATVTLPVNHSN